MSRIVSAVCLCLFLSLALAGNLSAQEDGSGIVFTGCPNVVEGTSCDSMFYQVVAVDIESGHPVTGVKYFLAEGPGTVDENSGLWVFHPELEDLPPQYRDQVIIGAVHGIDSTTADENCQFEVRVYGHLLRFEGYCGAHITVLPGDAMVVPLVVNDADTCQDPDISLVDIQPAPAGQFHLDGESGELYFAPALADAGMTFEVVTEVTSDGVSSNCHIFFDAFEPEPIKLRISMAEYGTVEPGDTVSVDLLVDAMPVDIGRMNLALRYEEGLLSFLQVEPGAGFFSPDSGCGWASVYPGGDSHCSIYPSRLLELAIEASDPSTPNCYRPTHFPAVLASVKFVVSGRPHAGEHFVPVDYYWCDCASNQLFSPGGDHQYFPTAVYDPAGGLIEPTWIPGPSGVLDGCYRNNFGIVERTRQVEYRNGGIRMERTDPPMAYGVSIGKIKDQIQGQYVDVPVTLHQADTADPTNGFGGFDLLIGYDAGALSFQMALEGDIYEECGWEYFTYRYGANGNCDGGCPSGLLRIVGAAETNNGPYHPGCNEGHVGYVETMPVTLATLRFLVSNDRTLECQFIPIRFFWLDCGDNALSNADGSRLLLSEKVFEFYEYGRPFSGGEITGNFAFPTFGGTETTLELEECFFEEIGKTARSEVWYQNGGVDIICVPNFDASGDINLNGLAYEIADAVMFATYFTQGLAVFPHLEGSIAASDVNKDGVPLTIEDFVYLVKVVIGEMHPNMPVESSPNPAYFSLDTANGVVSLRTLDTLGAVNLILNGEVTPTLLADQMSMQYGWDSGWTRILIYSFEPGVAITSGPLVSVPGAFGIVEANTATHDARPVESVIEPDDDHFRNPGLRIEVVRDQVQGQYVDVSINMEQDRNRPRPIGGFDLLISYDASALSFQKADEGEFFSECNWEYFTYRFGPYGDCDGGCPSGVLRITGFAESPSGDPALHPDCFVNDGSVTAATELASMTFLVSNDRTLECEFAPIKFTWFECSDNSLANVMGDTLLLTNRVFDYVPLGAPPVLGMYLRVDSLSDNPFPNATGITFKRDCLAPTSIRTFDFFGGGVDIACNDSATGTRGDINCNDLAWEINDAVMYTNYFIEGVAAFDDHVDCSIAAADCNGDGMALTLNDLVFLIRVIVGDLPPIVGMPQECPEALFQISPTEISISTEDSLGAVFMILKGEVTPTLLVAGLEMDYRWRDDTTRVMIGGYMPSQPITSGPLVSFEGSWELVWLEASNYSGLPCRDGDPTSVEIVYTSSLPAEFALRANYPNPFNPTTTIEYDLPRQAQVEIVVYNITGQTVRTLVDEVVEPGQHSVEWNGRNGSGEGVASGIYLYRIRVGDFVQTRKMLLLK